VTAHLVAAGSGLIVDSVQNAKFVLARRSGEALVRFANVKRGGAPQSGAPQGGTYVRAAGQYAWGDATKRHALRGTRFWDFMPQFLLLGLPTALLLRCWPPGNNPSNAARRALATTAAVAACQRGGGWATAWPSA
jgi:hypothetical protein